jgi:hypothetical protein
MVQRRDAKRQTAMEKRLAQKSLADLVNELKAS